ncbi:MAG: asparagine synthase (glutamine-hydrolyzing) [candidate division Zixibacteria bacterium]|nr:asparagine synthase (glutamine-hydrolyzing) [candidate division Zixibacteria bacterium]
MCGIAGILSLDNHKEIKRELLEDMVLIQAHRGPDEFGLFMDEGIGLSHARLSIIDLSTGGQPMADTSEKIWCVFNGEIYNYVELKPELERRGYQFNTTSDTEVLINQFIEKGPDSFNTLNGQFAAAFWDCRSKRLTLVRDRLGIRPLYYTVADGQLIFASEIKSILLHPAVDRKIDKRALDEIFTLWSVLPPKTVFEGIYEIPPGCYLTVEDGDVRVNKYWEPEFPENGGEDNRTLSALVDELKDLLIDSTKIRLRADVPVGAYLSGGIDSSAITAFVKNYTPNSLNTFSVTFEDKNYDERTHQLELADYLGTEHKTINCSYKSIAEMFPEVIWHTEKPILRTAPTPLMLLSGLVRDNNIKVVLTGEGADEFLGGYDIFKEAKIRRFWAVNPDSEWRPRLLERLYPWLKMSPSRTKFYLQTFYRPGIDNPEIPQFSHIPRWSTTSKIKMFYNDSMRKGLADFNPVSDFIESLPAGFDRWSYLGKAQFIEIQTLLSAYLLSSQGDRVAAANSIEGRYPFLDHRIVEFASKIPPKYKIRGLVEKYILREVVRGLIPENLRKRIKRPYMAPDAVSFLSMDHPEYIDKYFSNDFITKSELFKPLPVEKLKEKLSGLPSERIGFKDNMSFVGILSTMIFMDRFILNFSKFSSDKIEKWRSKGIKFQVRGENEHRRKHSTAYN